MLPLYRLTILTCCCTSFSLGLLAQDAGKDATFNRYAGELRYIREAPQLLPRLAGEGSWVQIRNYLSHWSLSAYAEPELIFSINMLVDIETGNFSAWNLPPNYSDLFDRFIGEAKRSKSNSFRYYINLTPQTFYDASPDARKLIMWIQNWASTLVSRPGLSPTQRLFCQVFSGQVADPMAVLARSPATFSDIEALNERMDSAQAYCQSTERNSSVWTAALLAGVWMPTGNLRALGDHPSIGLLIGKRTKWNEYDVVWAFRFLHPTPQAYTFVRNDTSYSSNYYDGGYIGFDYTRYFIHVRHWDIGALGAIAYDYFSVASGFGSNDDAAHWGSLNQGSFDVNVGLHLKYLFGKMDNQALGLILKYHCINYNNNGGTDLSGNAFTLDISYGLH